MRTSLVLLFLCAALWGQAQGPKYRVLSIPVLRDSTALAFPWAGGMNSPQIWPCDLNNDGRQDLFIFDRVGDKVLTYLRTNNNTDTPYIYAPQYEELFPADLTNWATIKDYNYDGIPDIFTYTGLGSRAFKGGWENGHLKYDLVSDLLVYIDSIFRPNAYISIDDIPAFVDVNRDGDMDLLTWGLYGATVNYYENQTKEHAGNPYYGVDSLRFYVGSLCWGNFSESGQTNGLILNTFCKTGGEMPQGNPGARHSGGTLYSFDPDNDHDVDLLVGDISYNTLTYVHNCGDSAYANVCSYDSLFPVCDSFVNMPFFPGAYGVDVDEDGLEDVLVAPNARTSARDVNNIMLYHNTTGQSCNFTLEGDTFLVNKSLDFGTDSKPVFFDYNGDGLLDLVIGNYGYFRPYNTYKSTLAFYENIGTATAPAYKKRTEDYNNMGALNLIAVHPAFGDLDGDGKQDLLIGDYNGYLHRFKNIGTTQMALFPTTITNSQYFGIDVGTYAAPFIYDVNNDGLNDLVVGRKDGKLSYFWNYGTATAAMFSPDSSNTFFGRINVCLPGYSEGYSAPFITTDSANNLLLYTGSYRGTIFKYLINADSLRSGRFEVLDSDILKHDVGSRSTVYIADLNSDGQMEYVIGNSRGGVLLYSDSVWDRDAVSIGIAPVETEGRLRIYPNPAAGYFMCEIQGGAFKQPKLTLVNILGENVNTQPVINEQKIRVSTDNLTPGIYFIHLTDAGKTYVGKIVVRQ